MYIFSYLFDQYTEYNQHFFTYLSEAKSVGYILYIGQKVVGRIGRILYHLQEIVGIKSSSFKFQVSLRFR